MSYFPDFLECFQCGYTIDNGGWTLVRHAPGGYDTWHPATDNLEGIDVYGDSSTGPMSRTAWSIPFDTAVEGYDEILFSSGDCSVWLITKKTEILGKDDESQS